MASPLADALLELERMDWRDLGIAAESAHPREARLEVLDRREGDPLCPRGAARDSRPEALDELWRHPDQKHRWKVLDILGPVAELHQRPYERRSASGYAPLCRVPARPICSAWYWRRRSSTGVMKATSKSDEEI